MRFLAAVVAIALSSGGCVVDVNYDGTAFRCTQSTDCPTGLTCLNEVCAIATSDAGVDAGGTDGQAIDASPLPACPADCSPLDPSETICLCGFAAWDEARARCADSGYALAKVRDLEASEFIKEALSNEPEINFAWLGGTDSDTEGTWKWLDGETFWVGIGDGQAPPGVFTDFQIDEPNDAGGLEDCLGTTEAGWNDVPCTNAVGYVCERAAP